MTRICVLIMGLMGLYFSKIVYILSSKTVSYTRELTGVNPAEYVLGLKHFNFIQIMNLETDLQVLSPFAIGRQGLIQTRDMLIVHCKRGTFLSILQHHN